MYSEKSTCASNSSLKLTSNKHLREKNKLSDSFSEDLSRQKRKPITKLNTNQRFTKALINIRIIDNIHKRQLCQRFLKQKRAKTQKQKTQKSYEMFSEFFKMKHRNSLAYKSMTTYCHQIEHIFSKCNDMIGQIADKPLNS